MSEALPLADLCDAHPDRVRVAAPGYRDIGGRVAFRGPARVVLAPEDNSAVRAELERPGEGRVLVVDGGGSTRCALLGDRLGELAVRNGWAGVVVHGMVRDSAILGTLDLGVKALGTCPVRSIKRGRGEPVESTRFSGIEVREGDVIHADADGWLVLPAD